MQQPGVGGGGVIGPGSAVDIVSDSRVKGPGSKPDPPTHFRYPSDDSKRAVQKVCALI